jgi:alcohol dehydrogenase
MLSRRKINLCRPAPGGSLRAEAHDEDTRPVWGFENPVRIEFGAGALARVADHIGGRRWALVTYDMDLFRRAAATIARRAGQPVVTIDNIVANPDFADLEESCAAYGRGDGLPEAIVALGGGSIIDAAKVLAASGGSFETVRRCLMERTPLGTSKLPSIIAVPSTAGTGSEVTSWATVWDAANGQKYSLADPALYPRVAVVDPELTLAAPRGLTLATGLDALSHALESLWNVSANPVSAMFAVEAAKEIMEILPRLLDDLSSLELRTRQARAALFAGLAFSNTRTAIAHSISYPLTLHHDVVHGIACSFTLPMVLRSVSDVGGLTREGLARIFGPDLARASDRLERFLDDLGVSTDFRSYGVQPDAWPRLILEAFDGERGRNFVGTKRALMQAAGLTVDEPVE